MGISTFTLIIALVAASWAPSPTFAQDRPDLFCANKAALWDLDLYQKTAQLRFASLTIDFEVADVTTAEPGPWPIALTLLSRRDTAIIILRHQADDFTVDILTQRRNLPILLTGTCSK